jgi:arabinan endo-1,5-alpha-L-arabinosidase
MLLLSRPLHRLFRCAVAACAITAVAAAAIPSFSNVTVHDPSVVRDGSRFYVFGSHLAAARSSDLMHWTQLSTEPVPGNPLFPNPQAHFASAISWVGGNNAFWAPDVIRLGDGRYYYYYCIGRLDQPRAVLGVAVADQITGPYTDLGIILRSGMWGQISPDGTIYDPVRHPNAVDPHVFFDAQNRLWMVYGSYSGGIFILELDPATGFPLPDQDYGKKLIGHNHARIEGAYILSSPESGYYYMFVSYGGLAADGGYNIRVVRSRQPDGPYHDAGGHDVTHVGGTPGTLFDDAAIAPYGVKLMGNYQFLPVAGEPSSRTTGYVSPGHNSAYYDPLTGQHYLVFHTRFVGRGEEHQVRVHQLYMNADEWLVAAPHRYAGETLQRYRRSQVPGDYKIILHGKDITSAVKTSSVITLLANGTITGSASGTWTLANDADVTLVLDGVTYRGVFSTQWNEDHGAWVYAFSALSPDGAALWGSRVVAAKQTAANVTLPQRLALYGATMQYTLPRPRPNPNDHYSYLIVDGPSGLSIDRATGELSWQPNLTQVDVPYPVTVLAVDTSADNPRQTRYTFTLTARSQNVVRRVELDFSSEEEAGLRDRLGQVTGFPSRLPGTGAALPTDDPNLELDTANGLLRLYSTRADFFGQVGLATNTAPAVSLQELGFSGIEDFSVTAILRPLQGLQFIDQVGVFVGANSNLMTRAGTIVWGEPERYSTHTRNNADFDQRFFGFGLNVADGMSVTLTRTSGNWGYFIDGVEWNPPSSPSFLDGRADLYAGVFAINPINDTRKVVVIDHFSLVVATDEPQMTALEAWRIQHFGQIEGTGIAADKADPDKDGRTNRQEFEAGTHPLDPASK